MNDEQNKVTSASNESNGNPHYYTSLDNPNSDSIHAPTIRIPKGGEAIKRIDEKFNLNSFSGTAAFSTPIPFSSDRNGYMPSLDVSYNSLNGNTPLG